MNDIIVKKLKKYLLFISILFFVSLGIHLIYLYLYYDSSSEAEQGGTISEAIIGTFPHLNPLVPSNDHNAYINGLLYRSLLEYSTESGTLESDIASCNIDNLLYIECVLENNLEWSDGTAITPEDIKATFNIISQTKVNPIIASLLENTTIETTNDSIAFTNTSKDINFLQIFLQPILPQSVVETLTTETIDKKFSEVGGIYSGRFILTNISQDETVGITKITLGKNEKYFGNPLYIQFLILNLFRDEQHFLKNKNSFNLFNDKDGIVGNSILRLDTFEYTLSQFVASFLNTETLSYDLRSYILDSMQRDEIIKAVGENSVLPALNPFLSEDTFNHKSSNINIEDFMKKEGYYSKKELLKSIISLNQKQQEEELKKAEPVSEVLPIEKPSKIQENLSIVTSPTTEKYNFTSEDNILISGNVPSGVTAVYINDYKLSGFSEGDDVFNYRLLESYDSIIEGENIYKIYFETKSEKKLVEEFVYIYKTDADALGKIKDTFFTETTQENTQTTNESESTAAETEVTESIDVKISNEEIQKLSDTLYYDVDGKAYTINLTYAQTDNFMQAAAIEIQKELEEKGIGVNISALSLGDITVGLRNESLEYDMMLIGVNLGYFGSNIFPYFHSSQVANGYNFSNFKKLSVDILLEELKSNTISITKQEELEGKLLEILKEENIIKVLYTPKIKLLVDKNIKNFKLPNYLPDVRHRFYPLINAYLSEKKQIQMSDKGVFDFIGYLFKSLFQ